MVKVSKTFIVLLTLSVILRLFYFNTPLVEAVETRQVFTGNVARNYYRNGVDLLYPEVDWVVNDEKSVLMVDYPLQAALISQLYKVFGLRHWVNRLPSLLAYVLSLLLLYKIVFLLFNEKVALLSSFFFAFNPITFIFSRTAQPDMLMVAFSLLTLYYFIKYYQKSGVIYVLMGTVSFSLALLFKLSGIALLPALAYLVFKKHRLKAFKMVVFYFFVIASFTPVLLWVSYTHQYELGHDNLGENTVYRMLFDTSGDYGDSVFLLKDYNVLKGVTHFFMGPVGCYVLFALLLAGFFLLKRYWFFHVWLVSSFLIVLRTPYHSSTHLYYWLPFVPVACLMAGYGLFSFWNKRFSRVLVSFLLVYVFFSAFFIVPHFVISDSKWGMLEGAGEVNALTNDGDRVIAVWSTNMAMLHYAGRMGYYMDLSVPVNDSIAFIEKCRGEGAVVFATAFIDRYDGESSVYDYRSHPELVGYLRDNYFLLSEGDSFVVYDLRYGKSGGVK